MKGLSFILLAAGGALIIFSVQAVSKAKELASQVKIKFLQFGTPEIKSNSFQLPVKLEVLNPLSFPVPVQNIKIDFHASLNNQFIKIGESPALGPVTFAPGTNEVVTFPIVYFDKVKSLFTNASAQSILDILRTDELTQMRIDLILTIGVIPITIPVYAHFNLTSLITNFV